MRALTTLLCCFPFAALGESFAVSAPIQNVTVYPDGAIITRIAQFDLPAGTHELVTTDLPRELGPNVTRVSLDGAQLGAHTIRTDFVPPVDVPTPEIDAANARIQDILDQMASVRDEAAAARNESGAAETQLMFLQRLGSTDGLTNLDAERLRAISTMIGEEALSARQNALTAKIAERNIAKRLDDLQKDLERAEAARDALVPETEDRAYFAVSANADVATKVTLSVEYFTEATWTPVYEIHLTRGSSDQITVERGAQILQASEENWTDISLTLSTASLGNVEGSEVRPWLRRIVDEPDPSLSRNAAGAPAAAPVIVESAAAISSFGLDIASTSSVAVTYEFPRPVTVASGADRLHVPFDALTFDATTYAEATPLWENQAFLVASFKNTSGEILLPAEVATLYLDDKVLGQTTFDAVPSGGIAKLHFGRILGLQLTRDVLDQNDGDRGLISRSNTQSEAVEISISNVTDETWDVRLFDRVPYSTQEDLEIEWNASPRPSDEDVDNKRGVLGWDMTLQPGDRQTIQMEHTLTWPDGKILQ